MEQPGGRGVAIAGEAIVIRAREKALDLVVASGKQSPWTSACACEFDVTQNSTVVCNERFAEVEWCKLLDSTQCKERVCVVVGGFGSDGLAFGEAVVDLLVVNVRGLAPRFKIADREVRPHVDKGDKLRFVRPV
eukprot:6183533-Pleurochrysis_carterae.AAC.5